MSPNAIVARMRAVHHYTRRLLAVFNLFVPRSRALNARTGLYVSGDTPRSAHRAHSARPAAAVILSRVPVGIALALTLSSFAATRVRAQVGSTTDILTGVVTGPDSKPLAGATVDAMAVDGQITRHAQTGANGRYTILFPDGGGQYRVTVRLIGMAPLAFVVNRQTDEDRLVRDVSLSPTSAKLQEVTVTARRRTPRDGQTPGATGRNLSGDQAERLPIDASDLAALAALAPGVVPIGATDSTSTAFSVAGQRPTANNITLDGLSFGGGSIPQDATRTTRIITNTYNVARGQFSGGQVATTTKGGTNAPAGSFSYSLRDRALQWGESSNGSFGGASTQNQLGGGFGGPIVKDKLFLFAAAQGRWRSDDLASLLSANPATLSRLGVASDSVARFLALVNGQGVPTLEGQVGDDRATNASSALARMDYIINDSHSLMIRADWRRNSQDPTRVSAYSLPMGGGTMRDQGGGLMAALTSHFGSTVINEGRAYASIDDRTSSPFLVLPAARVQISSNVADSALGITTLGFGGSPSLPQTASTKSLEVSDELSWLPGDASHRIKLGGLLNASRFDQDVTNNREGVFTFNSLADLENDQPASFSRTLAPAERSGSAVNPALYLGDTWRKSSALQLSYGVRLEGQHVRRRARIEHDRRLGVRASHERLSVGDSSESARWLHVDAGAGRPRHAHDDHSRWRRRVPESHPLRALLGGRGRDGDRGNGVAARVHRERRADARLERVRVRSVGDSDDVRVGDAVAAEHVRSRAWRRSIRISRRRARGAHRSACSAGFSIASA